jgi:glycosyltransferase involved in cell wall biosynthesis
MTVSEEEAADAKRLGIHRNPIAIGNGRDPAIFRPDAAARARLRAELGAEGCVVMGTARLVRHKGWPELLLAMRDLPGATLWVVGERLSSDHGDDLDGDFAEAARLLGPRLKMLGYRHDVAALLAAADIFCLPSHFEGLPMSIIEAMLAGLPVVATDIRGPRELVVDGQTGFLVPAGEAAPLAQLVVVFDRRRVHHRPQQARRRARRDGGRLGLACLPAALLARRLVEPRTDVVLLADLVEVRVRHHVVVFDTHGCRALR